MNDYRDSAAAVAVKQMRESVGPTPALSAIEEIAHNLLAETATLQRALDGLLGPVAHGGPIESEDVHTMLSVARLELLRAVERVRSLGMRLGVEL